MYPTHLILPLALAACNEATPSTTEIKKANPPQSVSRGTDTSLEGLIAKFKSEYGFTSEEVETIRNNPAVLSEKRKRLIVNYPRILETIAEIQQSFQRAYAGTANPQRIEALETRATAFLEYTFRHVLMPLWTGGAWAFYGRAESPQEGAIACGYFEQRIMEHLGFRIVTNPALRDPGDPKNPEPLQMGMLATNSMMWSYAGEVTPNLKNWEGLRAFVEKNGEGVYLLGISRQYSGHILFLDYEGEVMTVGHSGPRPGERSRVGYNDAKRYVDDFFEPTLVHAVKIDGELVKKWLTNKEILPKTKNLF